MSDDYLWEGSGEPDSELERLERLLSRLRHNQQAPELVASALPHWGGLRKLLPSLGAAAAIALIVAGSWLFTRWQKPAWEVSRLEGTPLIGSDRIGDTGRLVVGEWLETDGSSRAKINVGVIGHVEVEPNTRIRLLKAGSTEHRLQLARGTMHAKIWAPPRLFFVETPSAVAVDLGCAYTLKVDDTGAGLLQVTYGWVGFVLNGRESIVPSGAVCMTRPGTGPGTPYFQDASELFRDALVKLDFESGGSEALRIVLAESRTRDALTLWHLLPRVNDTDRGRLYDHLAALLPPPEGVSREGVLRLDEQMLDLWQDKLELPWYR